MLKQPRRMLSALTTSVPLIIYWSRYENIRLLLKTRSLPLLGVKKRDSIHRSQMTIIID